MFHKIKANIQKPIVYVCAVVAIAAGGYITAAQALSKEQKLNSSTTNSASSLKKTRHSTAPSVSTPVSASPSSTSKISTTTTTQSSSPKPAVTSSSLIGKPLYAAKEQVAIITQAASTLTNSSDAAVLNKLSSMPTAKWFGGWSGDIRSAVNNYVSSARSVGSVPVLVAYNIPFRDCGGESAGGTSSSSGYATWISNFALGIAGRQSIVILEPDAIAADCFSSERANMLTNAAKVLQSSGATVYLDGGNPTWRSAAEMANRLRQSGIDYANGFSLNVSNFQTTSANISYGNALSSQLGGKHFVIDTSRNGNGPTPDYQWCNPAGRALGHQPTTSTGNTMIDAFLWIKVPGESDGYCGPSINGSNPPSAGTYWSAYALQLARNAG